jgi:beta-galactosidase
LLSQNAKRFLIRFPQSGLHEVIVRKADGSRLHLLVMDKATALTAWESVIQGKKCVVFSEAAVLITDKQATLLNYGQENVQFSVYPKLNLTPTATHGTLTAVSSPMLSTYQLEWLKTNRSMQAVAVTERKWQVHLPDSLPAHLNDLVLNIDYMGDTGMAFQDGQLVADDFYKGTPWQIGLRQFVTRPAKDRSLVFYFRPIVKNAPFLVDFPAHSIQTFPALKVLKVEALPEYRTEMTFGSKR